ncbi:hypothetical protein [Melghirimyces algeriensis]|uniref:Uncharacterized protein n=1 Tax=Melghirimyces algeriensis TaxID=910412 RepID=A0A521FA19_9BACL|nr:hypothetical protein [Melghirimyces algeriensis]SMO93013.1 hypothetical protein SAMN06264849_11517 [Melghirimyces algeriensis]
MAETVTLEQAKQYFNEYVLHSNAWDEADDKRKQKSLNNAERVLYRYYSEYDEQDANNMLPWEAVCEQALWMLRMNDAILQAEQGVMQVSADGVSVLTKGNATNRIAPEAKRIVADAKDTMGRVVWTVI